MSAFQTLPADHVACLGCGVAVPTPDEPVHADVLPHGALPGVVPPPHAPVRRVSFGRCAPCQAIHDRARQMVADRPRLAAALGPDTAVHRVECGLLALDAVGATAPASADADDLVRLLAPVGASVRWLARLSPAPQPGTQITTCTTARWSHLSPEERQRCRTAQAATLRARVARSSPPVSIGPPKDCRHPGCLMCGVAAVRVAAVQVEREGGPQVSARTVWRSITTANRLGGRPGPDLLRGYLCPACSDAVDAVGAVGPTAMERAVVAHLGLSAKGPVPPVLDGLVGWAGLPGDPPPNAQPWDHCDLSRVVEAVG